MNNKVKILCENHLDRAKKEKIKDKIGYKMLTIFLVSFIMLISEFALSFIDDISKNSFFEITTIITGISSIISFVFVFGFIFDGNIFTSMERQNIIREKYENQSAIIESIKMPNIKISPYDTSIPNKDYKCAIIVDDNSETESTYLEFTIKFQNNIEQPIIKLDLFEGNTLILPYSENYVYHLNELEISKEEMMNNLEDILKAWRK